jgi:hypothetical protein
MRVHNGMRPHDIVILLKIISLKDESWQYRDLSASLNISISEISASLVRSSEAELIDSNRKKVSRNNLMDFIQFGIKYVFPIKPGPIITGIATAHSHPFYAARFSSGEPYVWPSHEGNLRGSAIEPLHKGVVKAALEDELLYKLLASVDVVRVGRVREIAIAVSVLKEYIL